LNSELKGENYGVNICNFGVLFRNDRFCRSKCVFSQNTTTKKTLKEKGILEEN